MNSFELGKKKDKGKLCIFHCSLQQPGFLITENTHQVLAIKCRQYIAQQNRMNNLKLFQTNKNNKSMNQRIIEYSPVSSLLSTI